MKSELTGAEYAKLIGASERQARRMREVGDYPKFTRNGCGHIRISGLDYSNYMAMQEAVVIQKLKRKAPLVLTHSQSLALRILINLNA